ncbi:group II intron maturase-specific domain-containing protein [Sphaerisporangium sp. B11E5]|uniref:group II intron maturase-specific domain-containing protein n=1 Tax=Sphaerisporangium sp. B11E5 TaxID=3153563 RepID=UPI00325CC85F
MCPAWARLNACIRGWMSYFVLADLGRRLRDVDEWFRRRMRQIRWKEWKRYSAKRRMRGRMSGGVRGG